MDIYVMTPDGTEPLNLTKNSAVELHPSWSPDGNWIYFDSNRSGSFDSYRVRPDGSDCEVVVSGEATDMISRESESGLVFNSDRDGDWELFWLPPGADEPQKLTDNTATDIIRDWSGDPAWVVFDSDRDTTAGGRRQLYVHDFENGLQRRLTTDEHDNRFARRGPPGSGLISFTSDRSGTRGLWLINPDTAEISALYDSPGEDGFASWSPDGTELMFQIQQGSQRSIYWMQVGTGEVEKIEPWVVDQVPAAP